MVSLVYIFWMYVLLFAIIGAMRGWAKELLVSFSVILAIFVLTVMERYIKFITTNLDNGTRFWFEAIILIVLVFFGYQSPNIPRLAANNRFARDRLQDTLLGIFLGGINGYLVFGSFWYFLNAANYPLTPIILKPEMTSDVQNLLKVLPPQWLGGGFGGESAAIYFAVALCFVFVLVVFV
jgi:hypothetical protein